MENKIQFNKKLLRELIKKRGLSLEKFSDELGSAGVKTSRGAIQCWLLGRMPRIDALFCLAKFFGVKFEDFLYKE